MPYALLYYVMYLLINMFANRNKNTWLSSSLLLKLSGSTCISFFFLPTYTIIVEIWIWSHIHIYISLSFQVFNIWIHYPFNNIYVQNIGSIKPIHRKLCFPCICHPKLNWRWNFLINIKYFYHHPRHVRVIIKMIENIWSWFIRSQKSTII